MKENNNYNLDYKDNYIIEGIGLILSQYKNSNLKDFLGVLLSKVQNLEFDVYDVYKGMLLENMKGVQLDRYGNGYNIYRNGLNDSDYRDLIIANVQLRLISGTPESIIQAVKLFTDASYVRYSESYPAGVNVYFVAESLDYEVVKNIQSFLPAGVNLKFVTQSLYDNPFTLSENLTEDFDFKVKQQNQEYLYSIDDNNLEHLKVTSGSYTRLDDSLCLSEVDSEGAIIVYGGKLIEVIK